MCGLNVVMVHSIYPSPFMVLNNKDAGTMPLLLQRGWPLYLIMQCRYKIEVIDILCSIFYAHVHEHVCVYSVT